MSESFQTVQVRDDRLNCKSAVKYAVEVGAAQVTVSENRAQSESTSSHIYNIIVPSEVTIIDRRVEWSSEVTTQLSFVGCPAGNGGPNNYDLLDYGMSAALCAFPLHASTTVMSATINNNTVTVNMDDVLALLIRFMDRQHIAKYTSTTPVMPDNYLKFEDARNATNNPLGSYSNSEKTHDYHARGALPITGVRISFDNGNTWAPGSIYNQGAGNALVELKFKTTEPFMCSPFIFAHEHVNSQGFYGVSNLNFRFNINPDFPLLNCAPDRVTPQNAVIPTPTCKITNFSNSKLTMVYLTPKPSMLLPYKNVVSFMEIPRYLTQGAVSNLQQGQTFTQSINQIQLNQVPDKLAFAVRRKRNNDVTKSDARCPITQISLNWNNAAGILSSANQQKLWLMSVEAGCNQSWYEFSGKTYAYQAGTSAGAPVVGALNYTPLVGGFLVLDFAKHIQLTEDYYAPGSIGQFALQANITFENQAAEALNANDYEIITYVINSGVWVNERSTSSQYTAILTKSDVLTAASQRSYYGSDVQRIVGAGMTDNLKSSVGSAMSEGMGASGGSELGGAGSSGGMKHRTK